MKRTIAICFTFQLLLLMNSCNIVNLILGVSEPSPVSKNKIEKKIIKYGLNEFPHLCSTDSGTKMYLAIDKSRNADSTAGYKFNPLIFKNNYLVKPIDTSACSAFNEGLLSKLGDSSSYCIDSSIVLSDLINNKNILNFDSLSFYQTYYTSDFTIFIYWATFQGVLNKPINKKTASNVVKIRNISSKKIQAYYINFDMRDSWK